jgi:hypothetical protein
MLFNISIGNTALLLLRRQREEESGREGGGGGTVTEYSSFVVDQIRDRKPCRIVSCCLHIIFSKQGFVTALLCMYVVGVVIIEASCWS